VALYCNRILHNHPDSQYAKQASVTLEKIRSKLTPEEAAVFIGMPVPEAPPSAPSGHATYDPPAADKPEPEKPADSRWWKFPRQPQPTETAPKLQPIDPEPRSPGEDQPARLELL
jgi:hypothetical protein